MVDHASGNPNAIARFELIAVVAVRVFACSGDDVEDFFAIGVVMRWVLMAGLNDGHAKSLFGIGINGLAHEPVEGAPGKFFGCGFR